MHVVRFLHFYNNEQTCMKEFLDKYSKYLALTVVVVSGAIMAYIVYEISVTKKSLGEQLVNKVLDRTHHELESFFNPVKQALKTVSDQAHIRGYHRMEMDDFNQLFLPIIENFPQVSSMGVADDSGFEYDLIEDINGKRWLARVIDPSKSKFEKWYGFHLNENLEKEIDSIWDGSVFDDPRARPWFAGAVQKQGDIFWTHPYEFNNSGLSGITASASWVDTSGKAHQRIIFAFDLTLEDISSFTQSIKPTENGEVMVVSGDGRSVVGYPQETPPFPIKKGYKGLFPVDSLKHDELSYIIQNAQVEQPFSFSINGKTWWGAKKPYYLDEVETLLVVIALPEDDFLRELNESQTLISMGFFGILLLTLLILRSHNRQIRQRKLLATQNAEIIHQRDIITAKTEEILDSINYARRIQQAILPPVRLVNNYLQNSFVLYLPKDIVAGDFYWMESIEEPGLPEGQNHVLLFASADCTGHGVPGAMVSVMCNNALNRTVREFGKIKANDILDKTRELLIQEFSKSENLMKDGMDISLCSLNMTNLELSWAGANNPLWIIREINGVAEIIERKADKQPVGNHISMNPFTNHNLQLERGDLIYVFTDGLPDQFGGEKGKKFKISQLRELLLRIYKLPMQDQYQEILATFEAWKGDLEQVDDICVIGVRV
jgi:serine phosphatase RsbU (regulator of sigma subunit)